MSKKFLLTRELFKMYAYQASIYTVTLGIFASFSSSDLKLMCYISKQAECCKVPLTITHVPIFQKGKVKN